MVVYMEVTSDEYELPLIVCDNVEALSKKCNVTPSAIHSALSRFKRGDFKTCRYRKVEIDDTEEEA